MDRLSFDTFTMEEAKERFYAVEATLARLRAPPDADLTGHPLFAHKYDRQLEEERKRLLDLQLRRTAAQAKADEELLAEAKQILGTGAGVRARVCVCVLCGVPPHPCVLEPLVVPRDRVLCQTKGRSFTLFAFRASLLRACMCVVVDVRAHRCG